MFLRFSKSNPHRQSEDSPKSVFGKDLLLQERARKDADKAKHSQGPVDPMNRMEQRVGLRWSIGYHVSMTWEVVCFFPLGPTRSMMILLDTVFRIGLRDLNPSACGLTTTGVIRG